MIIVFFIIDCYMYCFTDYIIFTFNQKGVIHKVRHAWGGWGSMGKRDEALHGVGGIWVSVT